jgi:hypothetical protein
MGRTALPNEKPVLLTESAEKTSDACIEPKKPTFFGAEASSGEW